MDSRLFSVTTLIDVTDDLSRDEQVAMAAEERRVVEWIRQWMAEHPHFFQGRKFTSIWLHLTWSKYTSKTFEQKRVTKDGELPLTLYVSLSRLSDFLHSGQYENFIREVSLRALRHAVRDDADRSRWLDAELINVPPCNGCFHQLDD